VTSGGASEQLITFRLATDDDAATIASIRVLAGRDLVARFGPGRWSSESTDRSVRSGFRHAVIVLASCDDVPAGTFRLTTRKPWAIDRSLFSPASRPLYLTDMAVLPAYQGRGVGRACLDEAERLAARQGADAIWLDAYNAPAGAGAFYATCGFRECGRRAYRGTPLIYYERTVRPSA
jgi:GNAT superfamily N-acetyltransferase